MRTLILLSLFVVGLEITFAQDGWFWQNPLPQGNNLRGVSFTDANTGTVVGWNGTILRTTDGGKTWMSQSSGTTNDLQDVSFTNANTGTAVGNSGTILHTTDGGATWTSQSSGTTNPLNGVCFTDANTGTVVGSYRTILRTT
ncbi:MAG: YCF48-related protein, partial [Bacteroidota bacterium]